MMLVVMQCTAHSSIRVQEKQLHGAYVNEGTQIHSCHEALEISDQ